ncbi:MAG: hypothetical protein AB7O48_14595 [Cyclobacteriaceae bacterium]
MESQNDKWVSTFKRRLPTLALVAPLCFFIASIVRAFGIGTLPGDLYWISSYEGLIMGIGVPFFVATFIFMGQRIAERSPNTGIWVTALGVLGTAFIAFISGFRGLAAGFVASGIDPKAINDGLESEGSLIWLSGILLYNFCFMFAWLIAGVAIMRNKIAPWWVGLAFTLSVPSLITAQALYINLEIFWPFALGLWLLGVWGLVKSGDK